MTISIIIPTYNEEKNIGELVLFLIKHCNSDVVDLIVSDGGSDDNTLEVARVAGANGVLAPGKGRSAQMNYGASLAKGNILYFIHADCYPPPTFVTDLQTATEQGYQLGRYRTRFDSDKTILSINAWFTRFDLFVCMGGDQTLFITKSLFIACNGFREDMQIMEEYEFCERARQKGRYKILKGFALISARKYETNSWWRVQMANLKVVGMYKRGATQEAMIDTYKHMLNYRKNAF